VDVETTGISPDSDKIIEFGICLFEYDRQNGRIYKILGSWEWFEDPSVSIPPEITKITGITDEMVAGHSIDDRAVNDLLGRVVLVIAHHASFDRRFLEKRIPAFATKHWACSRYDIDWKTEGIRSSALEFVAYSLGFFHDGHRAASDCRATLHALAQPLPGSAAGIAGSLGTGEITDMAVMGEGRRHWSPGEFGRPKCWCRDVADADKTAEVSYGRCGSPPERIGAGVGANLWILHWSALSITQEGAGTVK